MWNRRIMKEINCLRNFDEIINDRYVYPSGIRKKKPQFYLKYEEAFKHLASQQIKITNIIVNMPEISLDVYIKSVKFNFTFDMKGYPFKCPEIKLNGKEYRLCLSKKHRNYFNMGAPCLCCSSLTCSNNWRGTISIIDILNEYIEFDKLYFSRIRDKYNCKKYICINKVGFYLPIADFL